MSLGNKLMALGQWFEKHFPERLTAAEVRHEIANTAKHVGVLDAALMESNHRLESLVIRVAELEKRAETFNSDINKTKMMLLTQRQTR